MEKRNPPTSCNINLITSKHLNGTEESAHQLK